MLIHLIDSLHLFDGYSSAKMNEQYAFDTAYVSAVLADQAPEGATSPTRAVILQTMGMDEAHVSEQDLKTVKRVCEIVGRRAGRLSAVAIAAVVQHTGHDQRPQQESIDVGVDGSVYEHLPHFEEWCVPRSARCKAILALTRPQAAGRAAGPAGRAEREARQDRPGQGWLGCRRCVEKQRALWRRLTLRESAGLQLLCARCKQRSRQIGRTLAGSEPPLVQQAGGSRLTRAQDHVKSQGYRHYWTTRRGKGDSRKREDKRCTAAPRHVRC